MKKFTAFTLIELMVTVGIIGVIAALTVPNLVKNYQHEAQAIQIRKAINDIETAIDLFITEKGKTSMAETSISEEDGFTNFIRSHFKITKECDSNHTNECFANQNYMSIDGNGSRGFSCDGTSFLLENSMAICANRINKINVNAYIGGLPLARNAFFSTSGINIEVYVDTNGPDAPNIGGRDMFHFFIQPDGLVHTEVAHDNVLCQDNPPLCYLPNSWTIKPVTSTCINNPFGNGCLESLQANNWNMNY